MSQPKSAAETVAGAKGRVEEPIVRYKHVVISRLGGPEVLEVREEELPEPGLGEVRVRILATGVSLPDLMMREGVHPEAPRPPFTPGWALVGVFNYATAYQMMRRTARVKPGQRVLIHAAAGGIGTALLQLGRLVDLEMYGTASAGKHELVSSLGATPIDYHNVDFAEEVLRLTGDGVDVVFDGICSTDYLRRSLKSLRPGGKVVAYGFTSRLRGGRLAGEDAIACRVWLASGLWRPSGAPWLLPTWSRVTRG